MSPVEIKLCRFLESIISNETKTSEGLNNFYFAVWQHHMKTNEMLCFDSDGFGIEGSFHRAWGMCKW